MDIVMGLLGAIAFFMLLAGNIVFLRCWKASQDDCESLLKRCRYEVGMSQEYKRRIMDINSDNVNRFVIKIDSYGRAPQWNLCKSVIRKDAESLVEVALGYIEVAYVSNKEYKNISKLCARELKNI